MLFVPERPIKLHERSEHQAPAASCGRSRQVQRRDPRGASASERSNQIGMRAAKVSNLCEPRLLTVCIGCNLWRA